MTDLAKGVRYFVGKARAKEFYKVKNIMDPEMFDPLNWEDLHETLQTKPKIYHL